MVVMEDKMVHDDQQIQQMILHLIEQEMHELDHYYQIQQMILHIIKIMDQHFIQW